MAFEFVFPLIFAFRVHFIPDGDSNIPVRAVSLIRLRCMPDIIAVAAGGFVKWTRRPITNLSRRRLPRYLLVCLSNLAIRYLRTEYAMSRLIIIHCNAFFSFSSYSHLFLSSNIKYLCKKYSCVQTQIN